MLNDVELKRPELAQICERYEVIRLGLFGSAARGEDDPQKSDLDFLVFFDRRAEPDYLDRYLGLTESLEKLFGRSVDLVTEYSAHSPAFRAAIERDLVPLYERTGDATAA